MSKEESPMDAIRHMNEMIALSLLEEFVDLEKSKGSATLSQSIMLQRMAVKAWLKAWGANT